ncbi:hypothetical protein B7494_g709 [Chlorociboria aeruginascens]|nr:hypothetical protein B7494_g709 [Chlorociboria aeruginascens]
MSSSAVSILTPIDGQSATGTEEIKINSSLENLQTDEQRRVLDTVAQVRKCGLDSILSLPQLVVCGDQSAGKSSVLEALTEIPFPRNDNMCTKFATEIILRRGPLNTLKIRIHPDEERSRLDQAVIKAFEEVITDFSDLPRVMGLAEKTMGITQDNDSASMARSVARDVLSIEIEGPNRPQLTLVDIPGLIQTSTKGVSDKDIETIAEITEYYIKQHRTICLAVISAKNDAANQSILRRVRNVDPDGERTLGIITKPDTLSAGSGSESKFLELARNEDVFFKLGWHVLKNRAFEEGNSSLEERNASETIYFRKSNFKTLPKDNVGIDALRIRLSHLLFEHIKQELPNLREDLEEALTSAREQLQLLGSPRSKADQCRSYLTQLSLAYSDVCKAAVNGHYEGVYFRGKVDPDFSLKSPSTIARLRAVVQQMNTKFADTVRTKGHKYQIGSYEKEREVAGGDTDVDEYVLQEENGDEQDEMDTSLQEDNGDEQYEMDTSSQEESGDESDEMDNSSLNELLTNDKKKQSDFPIRLSKKAALKWVRSGLVRTRGKELVGNFNPLLIGELFWEQASHWHSLATSHVEAVSDICTQFLSHLLARKSPADIKARIWSSQILDAVKCRRAAAFKELDLIMEDVGSYPINYNHYYTDTVSKRRDERQRKVMQKTLGNAKKPLHEVYKDQAYQVRIIETVNVERAMTEYTKIADPNMENVSQKTFVANITTQVIERHIVRGLEKIFDPVVVNKLSDREVQAIASEPESSKRQREFLEDRIARLIDGQDIFRGVL